MSGKWGRSYAGRPLAAWDLKDPNYTISTRSAARPQPESTDDHVDPSKAGIVTNNVAGVTDFHNDRTTLSVAAEPQAASPISPNVQAKHPNAKTSGDIEQRGASVNVFPRYSVALDRRGDGEEEEDEMRASGSILNDNNSFQKKSLIVKLNIGKRANVSHKAVWDSDSTINESDDDNQDSQSESSRAANEERQIVSQSQASIPTPPATAELEGQVLTKASNSSGADMASNANLPLASTTLTNLAALAAQTSQQFLANRNNNNNSSIGGAQAPSQEEYLRQQHKDVLPVIRNLIRNPTHYVPFIDFHDALSVIIDILINIAEHVPVFCRLRPETMAEVDYNAAAHAFDNDLDAVDRFLAYFSQDLIERTPRGVGRDLVIKRYCSEYNQWMQDLLVRVEICIHNYNENHCHCPCSAGLPPAPRMLPESLSYLTRFLTGAAEQRKRGRMWAEIMGRQEE